MADIALVGARHLTPEIVARYRGWLADATGWYFDLDRHDPPEMLGLIDAELARQFAIVGTPEQCAQQMQELLDLGFDGVSCNLAAMNRNNMFQGLGETIEGSREMLRLLRS